MVTSPENSKINGLTFKELIKRGYSLEGNTRIWNIADSKLWYLEPAQAQGYLDLENSTNYKDATGQVQSKSLITENIDNIINQIHDDHINIIDLGCGDGTKAANIVRELKKKKPSLKIRYCPIDISSYMVEKAILTFHSMEIDEVIDFQYNISDFENLPNVIPFLRRGEYKKNLILLLGNTLGNFEIHELLYKIRSSMKGDDLFILDTAIDDKQQEKRVQSYNNSEVLNKWLIHIPLQLGLEEDEVKIGFRWKN
ncbi:MAG: L-histidine N(alpha)-methyltransferase, partial [Nanoarchaeota archaeon]|nr:L-histidine N(alpha)-methyltransferase [Nanoarchaeota archaeon]